MKTLLIIIASIGLLTATATTANARDHRGIRYVGYGGGHYHGGITIFPGIRIGVGPYYGSYYNDPYYDGYYGDPYYNGYYDGGGYYYGGGGGRSYRGGSSHGHTSSHGTSSHHHQ